MPYRGKLQIQNNSLKYEYDSQSSRFFFVEHAMFNNFSTKEIFTWIDTLKETGVNGIRAQSEGYNRNKFSANDLLQLQKWVSYARDQGIIVIFDLFNSRAIWSSGIVQGHSFSEVIQNDCITFSKFSKHDSQQYQERICQLKERIAKPDCSEQEREAFGQLLEQLSEEFTQFMKLENLYRDQQNYVTQVVKTLSPYENVIFGIMSEFVGNKYWHYEMSALVKSVLPTPHLISASDQSSPATGDPSVDIWLIHTGSYDPNQQIPKIREEVDGLWRQIQQYAPCSQSIIGYTTNGFAKNAEDVDLGLLAQSVRAVGLQIFSLFDQQTVPNADTYRAISTVLKQSPVEIYKPDFSWYPQIYDVFSVLNLPTEYDSDKVFPNQDGRAIQMTTPPGKHLCYGPYKNGYPAIPLQAVFRILIDDNGRDHGNEPIVAIDVCDSTYPSNPKVLKQRTITRHQFRVANTYQAFTLDFIPAGPDVSLEFRIFYLGYANICAQTITVQSEPTYSAAEFDVDAQLKDKVCNKLEGREVNTNTNGYLCKGLNVKGYPAIPLQAVFRLSIGSNAGDLTIVTIEGYDSITKSLWQKTIKRRDFRGANTAQDFYLDFTPSGPDATFEFRIRYHGGAKICAETISIFRSKSDKSGNAVFSPTLLGELINLIDVSKLSQTHSQAVDTMSGRVIPPTPIQGFLCYGNGQKGYPPGDLQVEFRMLTDNIQINDRAILIIDVYDATQNKVLGRKTITRQDFCEPNQYQEFTLSFQSLGNDSVLEFRVYYLGWAYILVNRIAVFKVSSREIDDSESRKARYQVMRPLPWYEPCFFYRCVSTVRYWTFTFVSRYRY